MVFKEFVCLYSFKEHIKCVWQKKEEEGKDSPYAARKLYNYQLFEKRGQFSGVQT